MHITSGNDAPPAYHNGTETSISSDDEDEWKADHLGEDDRIVWPARDKELIANQPWCRKRYRLSLNGLHDEMIDVYEWLRPSALEKALRYCVFERVRRVIQKLFPQAKVSVFGSLHTGLFLPSSDIDVVVEGDLWDQPPLWNTAEALKASGIADSIHVLDKAFVPIVKMVDKDTQISIDVSFNTIQGVRAAKYIEQMKVQFPVLEPLVLILKQFLRQRHLNQGFTGGLSSYGLILMLIHFLQMYSYEDIVKKSIREVNMGVLLLNFLQLYGQEFNYMKTAIRIGSPYVCREQMLNEMNRPSNSMLCIEDPLQRGNDIGRCSHNILFVRQALEQALTTLCAVFIRSRESSPFWHTQYRGSLLSLILSISPRQIRYRNWLRGRVLSDGLLPTQQTESNNESTAGPEAFQPLALNTRLVGGTHRSASLSSHSSLSASPRSNAPSLPPSSHQVQNHAILAMKDSTSTLP
ncbi:hypothetical protein AB6A40_008371 [Gnathostoma spinigerum]|uniref:polynucleotide adenylyltransferase n=1 Tax=Gnathostoma spinigerum TaxID=75299 RepID=A0ABD6EY88_9BILA